MHTIYLVLNYGDEREVVKHVSEVFPHLLAPVLAENLVVKTVDLCDLAGLVVAADHVDTVRVAHLEEDEQRRALH